MKDYKFEKINGKITITGCDKTVTEVIIPNEIEGCPVISIGNWAFYECENLISINIPDSVTSIGYGAFSGCSGLTSINIPDSVINIGEYAFSCCLNLTSINIPDSVKSVGNWAFRGCEKLDMGGLVARFGEHIVAA